MKFLSDIHNNKIAVMGLGYVGLPLAYAISNQSGCIIANKKIDRLVFGFDINKKRIEELNRGYDKTNELSNKEIKNRKNLFFVHKPEELLSVDTFIVTVPSPVDKNNHPDFQPIIQATKTISKLISSEKYQNNYKPIIIYESTVYPGATEEICIPLIEKETNLVLNVDFYCGYSPERINPGDKKNKIINIQKVTSGSDEISSDWVDSFYKTFIKAGTFKTKSIKIAEAAKSIENTQRDINIALINELTILFNKLSINTIEVLEAAETKWNFLKFRPGLVGGHCIGVDPYYLTYKANQIGYKPKMILAGRQINDSMSFWIAREIIKRLCLKGFKIKNLKILIMGVTFKENCSDFRNSKVFELGRELGDYGAKVEYYDPLVNTEEVRLKNNINVMKDLPKKKYKFIAVLVGHTKFKSLNKSQWNYISTDETLIYDLKNILPDQKNIIKI